MSDTANPEHLELIESLTDITFDPTDEESGLDPVRAVETTLLVLGRLAVRQRAAGNDKAANAAEDAIEAFGPIFDDLHEIG